MVLIGYKNTPLALNYWEKLPNAHFRLLIFLAFLNFQNQVTTLSFYKINNTGQLPNFKLKVFINFYLILVFFCDIFSLNNLQVVDFG